MVDDGLTLMINDFVVDYVYLRGASSSSSPSSQRFHCRLRLLGTSSALTSPPPLPASATTRSPIAAPTISRSTYTTLVHDEQHVVEFATLLSNDKDCVNAYHNDEVAHHG
ncbi:hypothetical protein GUJ93_ZPchr0002g24356 [Zizania palustris]|uniref:Uncharacterized protein n=1 Tax=Zizania palustris TaxID=103762 RepID=A0A8J5S8D2_ZIZPA|nr:hypothetical protein GUJ93_ZPchr0002g24356 [Zizania palustris]